MTWKEKIPSLQPPQSLFTIGQIEGFYLQLCERYRTEVDGSVIIAFHTQTTHFRPSKIYNEENWLPLAHVLMIFHEGFANQYSQDSTCSNKMDQDTTETLDETRDYSVVPSQQGLRNRNQMILKTEQFVSILQEHYSRDPLFSQTPSFNQAVSYITSLDFSNCKLGSNGAILFSKILQLNNSILRLDLSNNSIGPRGATALSDALCQNSTLLYLNLHGNRFYYKGALSLAASICRLSHSLIFLDLSNNHLNFEGVWAITLATRKLNTRRKSIAAEAVSRAKDEPTVLPPQSSSNSTKKKTKRKPSFTEQLSNDFQNSDLVQNLKNQETFMNVATAFSLLSSKTYSARDLQHKSLELKLGTQHFQRENLEVNLAQNLVLEEIWNSISHGAGFMFAVVGSLVLLKRSMSETPYHMISAWVFSCCLLSVYLFSTLYHAFFKLNSTTRTIFQRLDRCAIYLLIAGTYTPLCLVTFHGPTGWALLCVVWSIGIFGIMFSVLGLDYPIFSLCLYLVMAWVAVFFYKPLFSQLALTWMGTMFLLLGGASYMVGVVFFVLDGRIPYAHTIWHLFVIMGSALHWIMIYFYVMPSPIIHYQLSDSL